MASHRNRPRWLMLSLLVALAAAIAQGSRSERPAEQRRRLSDGSVVTLLGVTAGRPHEISTGNPVARIIAPLAPAALTRSTGFGRFTRPDVPPETPVAWIYTRATAPLLPTEDFGGLQLWTVGDEDGCETQLSGAVTHESGGTWAVRSYALTAFPRRRQRFALRGYRVSTSPKPTTEFWIPIQGHGNHPHWETAPVPVQTADGEVDYTLRRFYMGGTWYQDAAPRHLINRRDASTHLEIEATRAGRPATDWMPVSFELRDATGNRFDAGYGANPKRLRNLTRLSIGRNLFDEERTWRVRAEMARTPTAKFSAFEMHTFYDLAVPSRGAPALQLAESKNRPFANINGMRVEVVGIRWSSRGPPYTEVELSFPGARPHGWRVTPIRVVDDLGRAVPVGQYEPDYLDFRIADPPTVLVDLRLELHKPMKTVDVTIAVQKTRFVEFLASPTWPEPVGGGR